MRKMKIFSIIKKRAIHWLGGIKEKQTRIKLPVSVNLITTSRVLYFAHRFSLQSSRFLFINILRDYLCQRQIAERPAFSVWKWAIKVLRILSCACKESVQKQIRPNQTMMRMDRNHFAIFSFKKCDSTRMEEVKKYDWSGHSRVYSSQISHLTQI